MAKFVYYGPADLSKVLNFDRYDIDVFTLTKIAGPSYGDYLTITGKFETYYDPRYGDEGVRGPIYTISYKEDGKLALQITGLNIDLRALDFAENPRSLENLTSGNDRMIGSQRGETLRGGDDDDRIYGNKGNDRLFGGDEDDRLYGGSGDDRLSGGDGSDRLTGGVGKDILTGGSGRDSFVFTDIADSAANAARDVIRDFGKGDRIDLSGIDSNVLVSGNQTFRFIGDDTFSGRAGQLRVDNGLVVADVDGDGRAEFSIDVRGLELSLDHLIL